MKLFVAPRPTSQSSGGVFAVIAAHRVELQKLGVEYVDNERQADLVIVHALAKTNRPPDVWHCHGFYPTSQPGWGPRFVQANAMLIQTMLTARAVVSVSELAAEVMRRDFHIQPLVIRNGVNFREIRKGGDPDGFILWPKMDINPTCDPYPFRWLVRNRKDLHYAQLIQAAEDARTFGRLPRSDFLKLLRSCSIYMGTTRENNSMATMEAMSSGVPVAGYAWGFSREWLRSGQGCELVDPGDVEGLSRAIDTIRGNWQDYSRAAREFARDNFGWGEPIERIYDLYKEL